MMINKRENISKKLNAQQISYLFLVLYLLWWIMEVIINNYIRNFSSSYIFLGGLLILGISSQVGLNLVPGLIYSKYKQSNIKEVYNINPISRKQLILSFILFLSSSGIAFFLDSIMNLILNRFGLHYEMNDYIIASDIPTLIILIIVGGIITPICEELFYRGFLISGFKQRGIKYAIVYSAFCFFIMHTNPYRLSGLLIYSISMGLVVYYTNSTLPGIIFHILTNTLFEIGSFILRGNLVNKYFTKNNGNNLGGILILKYFVIGSLAIISVILSIFAIRRLKEIWKENGGENRSENIIEVRKPFYKMMFNLPFIMLIFLFILKVKILGF